MDFAWLKMPHSSTQTTSSTLPTFIQSLQGQSIISALELKKVKVTAKSQTAQPTLEQTFYNPSNQRIEGSHIFPIPKNAEIESFQMEINGKRTKGEISIQKKQNPFMKDIRESRDPALLEYTNRGIFKIRVFPIEPKKDKNDKS